MLRIVTALSVLGLLAVGQPASAAPPADAKPLSEIIETLEANTDVAHVADVEWDDKGYWEVDYVRKDGSKVEVKLDPVTGELKR